MFLPEFSENKVFLKLLMVMVVLIFMSWQPFKVVKKRGGETVTVDRKPRFMLLIRAE
jgi:hypothetical protein